MDGSRLYKKTKSLIHSNHNNQNVKIHDITNKFALIEFQF